MTQILEKLIDRFFKIYFILSLIAFTTLVLLMNVPSAFPTEQHTAEENAAATHEGLEIAEKDQFSANVGKLLRWKVNRESINPYEDKYLEWYGTRLRYKMNF